MIITSIMTLPLILFGERLPAKCFGTVSRADENGFAAALREGVDLASP